MTDMGAKVNVTQYTLMLPPSGGTWRTARFTQSATLPRPRPQLKARQALLPLRTQRSHQPTAAARPAVRRPGTAHRRRVRPRAAAAPARQRLLQRLVGPAATAPAPLKSIAWITWMMRQPVGALTEVQERHLPRGLALQELVLFPSETATGAPWCNYVSVFSKAHFSIRHPRRGRFSIVHIVTPFQCPCIKKKRPRTCFCGRLLCQRGRRAGPARTQRRSA